MNKLDKNMIIVVILSVIIFPLLVLLGVSADILNWATNDNDWIGFWGGYIGTLIGGAITLFVLFRSLADNKKTLQETLANERHIQECNEISMFCNVLVEKCSIFSVEVEEMIYKAHFCVIMQQGTQKVDMEITNEYLKKYRIVRSILIEMSMHLDIVADKKVYSTKTGAVLSETVQELIDLIKKHNREVLDNKLNTKVESQIYELSNNLFNQTQEYLKGII